MVDNNIQETIKLFQDLQTKVPAARIDCDGNVIANTEAAMGIIKQTDPNLLAHLSKNQFPLTTPEGKIYQPVVLPDPQSDNCSIIFLDITSARYDALTGASNRAAFNERLISLKDSDKPIAILFADLDGFKEINDTYGHSAGDELLCATVNLLRLNIGRRDLIARYGGDEIAIVIEDAQRRQVEEKLEMIEEMIVEVNKQRALDKLPLINFSIKYAIHEPGSQETLQETVDRADRAMYEIKRSKREQSQLVEDGAGI